MSEGGDERLETPAAFTLRVGNDLEEHRARTLLTKEPETIAWIDSFEPGAVFYDVGANVGIYSLYAAVRIPAVRVVAFEPFHRNFGRLVENIVDNRASAVTPLAVALSGRTGIEVLHVPDTRLGASGAQLAEARNDEGRAFEPLQSVGTICFRLDDAIEVLGLPRPSHVKIDVDGREADVLEGMQLTLPGSGLESVLVEVNMERTPLEELHRHMAAFGLRPDDRFNERDVHSRTRRRQSGSSAENVVYSRARS